MTISRRVKPPRPVRASSFIFGGHPQALQRVRLGARAEDLQAGDDPHPEDRERDRDLDEREANTPGGPSSARPLRGLRASDAPGPTPARLPPRAARALSRSASHSPGGPSSARALRALRASVAPGPPSPPAPAGGSPGGRPARYARSGRAGRGKAAPGKPSRISWGHACARALRALRCHDLPKGTGPSARLGRTGLAASAGWTAQL